MNTTIPTIAISRDGTVIDTDSPEDKEFFCRWQPTSTANQKDVAESQRVAHAIKAVRRQCCFNSRRAILKLAEYFDASLIEGWVLVEGVLPIEHAWIVRNGVIIDPTLPEDRILYFPGLEFAGRKGIQAFLETPQGKKCRKTAFFYAFGWGGMKSPSFRKSWDAVKAIMIRQSEAEQ